MPTYDKRKNIGVDFHMKRIMSIFLSVCLLVMFTACGNGDQKTNRDDEDIKDLVHLYSVGKFEHVSASISSHELMVTDENGEETVFDLPEAEFFVSIAPFETTTHPCAIHNLTGCQGEFANEEFSVYIEDEEGHVILDDTVTSLENGFIDLWLPRNKTFHVTIKRDGKVAEGEISTFKDDHTCITTMQLL